MNNKTLSIVLTIHNKDWLIRQVINQIYQTTTGNYELVFVVDGCTDQSEHIVDNMIQNAPKNVLCKKIVLPNVFETKANNAGMKSCYGDNIVIVQDDMIIKEHGWNERMSKPLSLFDDVFAVTARTAHNWEYNPNNQHEHLSVELDNCWCDVLMHTNHAHRNNTPRNVLAIRDSVNRGPLMMKHDVLKKLNYLDEVFDPQDMDDHDLCYRAYKELGMKAGCYWIDFESQDNWGGTRVNGSPAKWLLKANHKNVKIVWKRHKDLIVGKKHDENIVVK